MSLKPADIDNIIQLLTQITEATEALNKTDFLTPEERSQFSKYSSYELWQKVESQYSRLGVRSFNKKEDEQRRKAINYDKNVLAALKNKLEAKIQEYIESTIKPLQKRLDLFLSPRWSQIVQIVEYSDRVRFNGIKDFLVNTNIGTSANSLKTQKEGIVNELERIKAKLEYLPDKAEQKTEFASGNKADLETARTVKKKPLYKKVWPYVIGGLSFLVLLTTLWLNIDKIKEQFSPKKAQTTSPVEKQLPLTSQQSETAKIFAYVSPDGKILRSNNFSWKITKAKN